MNLTNLSPKYRSTIALSAAVGTAHVTFRAFMANFGPFTGMVLGVACTFALTYAIYWAMSLPLKKSVDPS